MNDFELLCHKGELPIPDRNGRHLPFVSFVFSGGSNFFVKRMDSFLLPCRDANEEGRQEFDFGYAGLGFSRLSG